MPIFERLDANDRVRRWTDSIPLQYHYTAGVAGERFLRALRNGKLVGGRCTRCGLTFIPPKIYCVKCFGRVERLVDVPLLGRVGATTSGDGRRRAGFVFVTFDGVVGGLVHRALGRPPKIGARVRVRFRRKSERKGSILDIAGFEPA